MQLEEWTLTRTNINVILEFIVLKLCNECKLIIYGNLYIQSQNLTNYIQIQTLRNGLYGPFSWKQDPGAVIKFNLQNKITQINYNYPEKS